MTRTFPVLLRMQVARLRRSWRQYLIVSSTMPAGIMLLLRAMLPHPAPQVALQIVAGNIALAVAITAIVMLAQRIAWMRQSHVLDYYATLPVPLGALVLAVLLSYLMFALPGMALVLLLGALSFHLPLHLGWILLPDILLLGVALSGIGVLIGLLARDEQLAGLFGNLVMMAVLFLGVIPASRVPLLMRDVAWALPSTYGVRLLIGAFQRGAADTPLLLLGLALYGAALFALALTLRARQES